MRRQRSVLHQQVGRKFGEAEVPCVSRGPLAWRTMRTKTLCTTFLGAVCALIGASTASAQGCLAAHTNSGIQGCITSGSSGVDDGSSNAFLRHHPVTVEVDWRSFSSFRHFSGTVENTSRQALGTFIPNHQNIYNVSLDMQVTPRWSVNAFVPVLQGTRDQKYAPVQKVEIAGIGDMIVGVQGWVLRAADGKRRQHRVQPGAEAAHRHQQRHGHGERWRTARCRRWWRTSRCSRATARGASRWAAQAYKTAPLPHDRVLPGIVAVQPGRYDRGADVPRVEGGER